MIVIFLAHFCPREKGAMRLSLCEATTRETRSDHNTWELCASTKASRIDQDGSTAKL